MNLIERPNLLSILILGLVVLIAGTYGILTYTQSPDLEHYAVDPDYNFPYNFDGPDQVFKLPSALDEISGLAAYEQDTILAIQDEDGKMFMISTKTGKIERTVKFGKDRDYEGIARKGDTIYVLERDGDIHQFNLRGESDVYDAEKRETSFSYRNDTEGIAYDDLSNTLLIVPKEQELNPTEEEEYRHGIYSYDLAEGRLLGQPSFYIDEFEVGEAIYGKRGRFAFKPSGIAVHPETNDIYVIASVGKIMVVINRESQIKHIEVLRESIFRQPEGLDFAANGDLYISSEGRGGTAILARYQPKGEAVQQKEGNE